MSNQAEEELFATMAAAVNEDAIPIAMMPYQGPPPDAEFYLTLLRDMIERTGSATGCICFGTTATSGMFPLVNVDPQDGLSLLILLRQQGLLQSVSWVTLASDSWRRKFGKDTKPEDIHHGDLEQMHDSGDPEVEEVLVVSCKAPDGPGYDVSQAYVRKPDGIEWAEIEYLDPRIRVEGEINRLMTELVNA